MLIFARKHIDANGKTLITLMKHSEMNMSQKKCFVFLSLQSKISYL